MPELTVVKSWALPQFDPTPEEARTLAEIRTRESSGDYAARNPKPGSTASGAYQFTSSSISPTWQLATKATGAPVYSSAAEAPQAVQDANALHMLRKYGPDASITWAASGPYQGADRAAPAPAETPKAAPIAPLTVVKSWPAPAQQEQQQPGYNYPQPTYQSKLPWPLNKVDEVVDDSINYMADGIMRAYKAPTLDEKLAGLSETMRGFFNSAGTPLLLQAGMTAPVKTAVGLGTGLFAQKAAQAAVEGVGGGQGTSEFAGDIAGIVTGVGTSRLLSKGGALVDVLKTPEVARQAIKIVPKGPEILRTWKAFQKARAAVQARSGQAPASEPATEPTKPAAQANQPVTGPTDDALLQLYSVETNPAKRSALQAQLIDRGLMNPPGAAPTTPPEANPYRGYSQDALRKVYAIEPEAAKRALIEQAARNRGLSLLTREGRRATAAVPETGEAAEARGPSLTQDEALILRFLGTTDPLSASAADIATARQLAVDNPELLRRLRAGEPEPVVAQPTPAEKAMIAQPAVQSVPAAMEYNAPGITPPQERIVRGARQAGEFTPEEQARAAAILENVEPQAPATPPTSAEALKQQLRAEMEKSGTIAPGEALPPDVAEPDVAAVARESETAPTPLKQEIVNSANYARYLRKQGWTAADAQKMTAAERETLAKGFGNEAPSDAAWERTLFQMRRVEKSGYEYGEKITAKTPEAAKAEFEQKRKGPATATVPTPATDLETQLADSLAGKRTTPPPEGPRALTAAEERVEAYAQHFAADTENITSRTLDDLPKSTNALLQLEALGKRLGIKGRPASLDEVQQIVDRVRQLRGEAATPVAPAGISGSLDAAANAAMQRMRDRGTFTGSKLSAGIPVDDLADMAIWGAAKIAKGTVDFAKWSKEILAEAGSAADQIKPHLKKLYAQAQNVYARHVATTEGKLANTKQLLKMYQEGKAGEDWYKYTQAELQQHFGEDAPLFVDMLAATSPNSMVASNVTLALKAYTQHKTGQPFQGFMPSVIQNLEKVVHGEPVGGPKVSSFKANLFGNTEAVTVDRWMARAMGWPTDNITPGQYKFIDYTQTQIAKKAGVEPRQMQAAIWKAIKESQGKAGNTSASFEQVLQRNIATKPELAQLLQDLRSAGRQQVPLR